MSTKNYVEIVSSSEPGPALGMEFLSYTYVVGKLTLQLLAPRWKDVRDRGRRLIEITPNEYWNPAVVSFWPYDGNAVSWPPEKFLGDDTIQQFIHRFNETVRVKVGNY